MEALAQELNSFKPVELTLTFKSAEELKLFKLMFGFEGSIPRMLMEERQINEEERSTLTALMKKAYYALSNFTRTGISK